MLKDVISDKGNEFKTDDGLDKLKAVSAGGDEKTKNDITARVGAYLDAYEKNIAEKYE